MATCDAMAEPLVPLWCDFIEKYCLYEASLPQVQLLREQGRNAVWQTCKMLGWEGLGVPGAACRLLERYIFIMFNEYHTGVFPLSDLKDALLSKFPVLIAACIMLTSKMNSADHPVTPQLVRMIYKCNKIKCTIKDILDTEIKIYNKLEFKIPLWTGVEVSTMLAMEVGFPAAMFAKLAIMIDKAEFKRHILAREIRGLANLLPCPITQYRGVLSMHLIAGTVAAAGQVMHFSGADPVPRLAELTRAPENYIRCVRDFIYHDFIRSSKHERSLTRKRKISEV